MMSNKVILTYKRKRLQLKLNKENGVKTDIAPKVSGMVSLRCFEQKSGVEDQNEDNVHCSTCSSVDVNEKLLMCDSCSESYHLRCIDPPLKNFPEEKWQCSACAKKRSFEGSMQHKPPKKRRKDKNRNSGEPDLGPMKLRSCKLLLNTNSSRRQSRKKRPSSVDPTLSKIKDTILADDANDDSGAASKAIMHTQNSITRITRLEVSVASNHLHLNSNEEMPSPECRDVILSPAKTDATPVLLNNDENSKENCRTPVITFSRRTKKKQYLVDTSIKSDPKLVEEQSGSAIQNNLELAVSCKCADSSVNLSGMDHLTSSANLSGQADHSFQHDKLQNDVSDNGKDSRLEDSSSGGCVVQGASDEIMVLPTSEAIRDSCSASKDKKLNLANIDKTVEGQENRIIEEECFKHDLETSVAGDPFACLTHKESNKQTGDATTQNPLESQSSSSQNCVLILVDEDTGDRINKVKAMDISNLCEQNDCDKVRTSSSCLEDDHTKCIQPLEGTAPRLSPIDLSSESKLSQNEFRARVNNKTALQEELSRIKSDEVTGGKRLHEEARSNPSLCTNILGLSLSLNPKVPENSILSCYDIPISSSNSSATGIKDYDGHLLWGVPGEHASVPRRDKAYDNFPIGLQMIKESQTTLSSAFKRFLPEWSEEELDSLWIGVRRHGLNNWNTILRDPKLYFFSSRVPKDLAEQWNREQIKLRSGSLHQTTKHTQACTQLSGVKDAHLAMRVASDRFDLYGVWPASFQIPTIKALDTRLSLGDVYSQSEHRSRNSLPQLSGDKVIADKCPPASSFGGCTRVSSSIPTAGIRNQASLKAQHSRYDCEASTSHKKLSGRLCHDYHNPVSNALPHWLKDALNMPPTHSSIKPSVSGIARSFPNNNERTPLTNAGRFRSKFLQRRGMLKRKSTMSDNNASLVRMTEYSLPIGEVCPQNKFGVPPIPESAPLKPTVYNTGLGPIAALDLEKINCSTNEPNDLVVINSDASSEETISDDQGSR